MPEDELEQVMLDFVAHRFDILLATTIVESGLDIPNATPAHVVGLSAGGFLASGWPSMLPPASAA